MRNIIACLCKSSVVQTVDVIEIIDEPEIQLLYVRVTLANQTLLYIREVVTIKDYKYSYHWQTKSGELIRRWDNAPHWQKGIDSVYHVHVKQPDAVEPSSRVTVEDVLKVISDLIDK